MSILSFATYALSAIWLTPYLVKHLGVAAYGLVPLAGLFTQYVSIITANLSSAVNRFLTIELQKPDGNPNSIFNSSLALYIILIVIQLPLFAAGLFYADDLFSIPPELKTDTLLLLGCSMGGFLLSLLSGVFRVSLYSRNRLDISSSLNLGRLIIRLALITLLFSTFGPKLRFIGYIDLALNVLTLGSSVFFWRKLTPELFIRFNQIDIRILKPIFRMSMWTLINNFGSLLYLRTDIWIINRFISPVIAGQYAAVLVVSNFIRQMGTLFSNQFGPISMSYWAKGELVELRRLLLLAMKLLAICLAIPTALICINGKYILSSWLGSDFTIWATLLTILCIHLPINAAVTPLFQLQTASNSVRVPALMTFFMGVCNVIISYVLGVRLGMGAIGVALTTAIVLTLKNALFTPLYAAHILKLPFYAFVKPLYTGILMLGFVWLISLIPMTGFLGLDINRFLCLGIQCGIITLAAGALGWILLVSKEEKLILINMLPVRIKPYIEKLCPHI